MYWMLSKHKIDTTNQIEKQFSRLYTNGSQNNQLEYSNIVKDEADYKIDIIEFPISIANR